MKIVAGLLILFGLLSGFGSIQVFTHAKSAIHEIEGYLMMLLGVVSISSGIITYGLSKIISKFNSSTESTSEDNMKKCPFCAEMIKNEAIVCRYCGKDLPQSPSEPSSVNLSPYQKGVHNNSL